MSEMNDFDSITSNTSLVLATGQDDHRDASDARLLSGNKNLHNTLEMGRRKKRSRENTVLRTPEEARAIKLRKVAKSLGVVSARMGRTRSKTKQQAQLSKIQAIAKLRHRQSLLKHVHLAKTEHQYISQVFGKQKDYVFDFNPLDAVPFDGDVLEIYQSVSNTTGTEFQLLEQLRRLYLQNKFKSGEGTYYKVVVLGSDYESGVNERAVFSTKHYPRFADVLRDVKDKIDDIAAMYTDEDKDIKQVVISELKTNLASVAASSARRAEMHSNYIIPAEYNTKTNCAYTSIAICRDPETFVTDYNKQLQTQLENSGEKIDFTKWAQKGHDIKKELNRKDLDVKKGFASTDDLRTYVDAQVKDKRDLIIRDAQFKIVERMQAPKSKDSTPWRKKKQLGPPLELQRVNNHIRPLIPRASLPTELVEAHDAAQKGLQTKPLEDPLAKKIVKDFVTNARRDNDERIMTADIETSNKAATQEELQRGVKTLTYAAGCAWYRNAFDREKEPTGCESHFDADREILYKSWWGGDALTQYMLFLDANQEYFHKTTIYFHNGGKFDLHQLIRDCLFDYWGFKILTDRCIMSNGRWINFGIEGEDNECVMTFKDSYAMIPSGLSKMARDYKVPHYKKDDVDHDTIMIDNWHEQKDKLEVYLRHDCLSLLEVLKRHSDVVFNETYCEKFELNKDECHTLNVLESLIIGSNFTKRRDLSWLKCPRNPKVKLELDGYDENLGIAVEVQSPEHYKFIKFFHKDEDGFKLQQERDQAKVEACKKQKVHLILVPHTQCVTKEQLVSFLTGELQNTDLPLNESPITDEEYEAQRVIQSGHLTMTQCMTASGLAKKWFYHSFYDKKQFPIFTLTPEQDAFIRDQSYLGGRVELFKFGHIHNKVYYLDFTSLYPAMMVKDLPYSEPYEATFDGAVLPDDFFGFVRCKVKSSKHGLTRLPLHGEKIDGKLKFRHLVKWQELVLFSEEIREGIKQGLYEYEFIDGVGFKRGKHLEPMVRKLFKMKADAKREGKDALSSVLKIVLNSLYGFWGTRTADREGLEIYLNEGDVPFFDHLEKQQLVDITEHERYTVLRVEKDLPIDDINVSIAAATTSYARVRIWSLMDAINTRGGEVYMCDTDSVITNCDLSLHADLMAEYIPDYQSEDPGAELGSLKCECTDEVKKALKAAKYTPDQIEDTLNEMRGGDTLKVPWKPIPYDQCILAVLKTYALRKELPTGNIFTFKHKGVSKALSSGLSEEQEEALWETYLNMHLKQTPLRYDRNLQFRAGLGSYMNKAGLVPLMKYEVPKDVLAKYDKGNFETEDYVQGMKTIVPLTNVMDKDNRPLAHAPKCRLQFVPQAYTENRIEYIDGKNLQLLIDELSKYSVSIPTKPRKSMSNEEREVDNIRLFKNYVMTLQKKVEINNKGESFINVTYTRKSCGGRRYSIGEFQDEMGSAKKISYSLQGMYGILRRFLIGKWCHDIDIVNCIPTILIQIAEQDQVPYRYRETLGFYIMHRQQCLEKIMEHHGCTKEDAKDAVIRIYNGGTFKKWADDWSITLNKSEPCPFLEDLKEEIEGMKSHMLALPKYKAIRNACLKLKSDKSIDQAASDRSAFATICFKKEDEILQAMEQSINNDGWRSETLIYDGIPVYDRNGLSLEPSLRRAEDYVFQQTGINIKLAEKPMFNENLTVHNVLSHISNR